MNKRWEIMREIPSHSEFIEKYPETAGITKEEFDKCEDEWLYFIEKLDKEIVLEERLKIIKKSCFDTIEFYREKEQKVIEEYKTESKEENYSEKKGKLYLDFKALRELKNQWEENMQKIFTNSMTGVILLRNIKPSDKKRIEELGFAKWLYHYWIFLTLR